MLDRDFAARFLAIHCAWVRLNSLSVHGKAFPVSPVFLVVSFLLVASQSPSSRVRLCVQSSDRRLAMVRLSSLSSRPSAAHRCLPPRFCCYLSATPQLEARNRDSTPLLPRPAHKHAAAARSPAEIPVEPPPHLPILRPRPSLALSTRLAHHSRSIIPPADSMSHRNGGATLVLPALQQRAGSGGAAAAAAGDKSPIVVSPAAPAAPMMDNITEAVRQIATARAGEGSPATDAHSLLSPL